MVILPHLKRLVGPLVLGLRARFLQWTAPLTCCLPLATVADLARSKAELVAENALLRQQLIILKRQVKRPACSKTDRVLLVLLARVVRTWKQALFIVQPDTLLRWHRELFRLYWKRRSKASSHQPKVAAEEDGSHPPTKGTDVGDLFAHPLCWLLGRSVLESVMNFW